MEAANFAAEADIVLGHPDFGQGLVDNIAEDLTLNLFVDAINRKIAVIVREGITGRD